MTIEEIAAHMEESPTWRTLLGEIVAEPQERQRIARVLNVNPVSLVRWVTGTSNPRPKHLRVLLEALPDRRQRLLQLILAEYPHFLMDISMPEELPMEIPIDIYVRILDAHTHIPQPLRFSTILNLVLRSLLAQFDIHQEGMGILLTALTPPRPGQHVRSLYTLFALGTVSWYHIHYYRRLFGLESPVGYAAQARRPFALNYTPEDARTFTLPAIDREESLIVYPLIHVDQIAGCLCIMSGQEQHFSSLNLELIDAYVNLLILAFPAFAFYPFDQVELAVLPDCSKQRPYILQFEQSVIKNMLTANRAQQLITRPEAETLVWQDFEAILLQ